MKILLTILLTTLSTNSYAMMNCQTYNYNGNYNTNCYNYNRQPVPQMQLNNGGLFVPQPGY